ncbi:DUF805 domain-containing protein [Aeromicrobium sp. CFBP 8757]|uniref:DUF805 domain-containing protein n=1 Tax=Aeromicrobium sp. CFBP 8757 TaxID=2775288 RepID=UPI001782FCD0|nr:DUF805 domain-containing protein [Aeromicrobium sp. CFBP 8757]MBD8606039.1 DUF805 domain-containing protein [Aeromicrobium sp. CFBP 8757]
MNMQEAVQSVLSQYANFNGRARRSEYWFFTLALFIASIVAGIIDAILGAMILQWVLIIATIVPSLSVGARRLHDTDKSGWLQLIGIIPIVGWIVLIVFFATDSGPDNKYGPNPKQAGAGSYDPYGTPPPAV